MLSTVLRYLSLPGSSTPNLVLFTLKYIVERLYNNTSQVWSKLQDRKIECVCVFTCLPLIPDSVWELMTHSRTPISSITLEGISDLGLWSWFLFI